MDDHIEQEVARVIVEAWGDDAAHPIWTIQEGASTVKASITHWRGVDRAVLVEVPFGSNLNAGLINLEVFGAQKIPDLSPYFPNIKDPTMRELAQECIGKLYAWYDGEIPNAFKFGRKPQDPNSFEGLLQACTVHITTVDRSLGDASCNIVLMTVEIGRLLEAAKWKLRSPDYFKGLKFRPKTTKSTAERKHKAKTWKKRLALILDREIGEENFPRHGSSGKVNYSKLAEMVLGREGLSVSSRSLTTAIRAYLLKEK